MLTLMGRKIMGCFAASVLAVTGTPCYAKPYPSQTIRIVVPFSSGGPTESVARALADAMRPTLGQTAVVQSYAGGGGTIGTSAVAKAEPDGYTVLLSHMGFAMAPELYKDPGYDVLKSFEPIGMLVDMPMTIMARKNFPPQNVPELVSYLKKNQAHITMAHGGLGAASYMCGVLLMDTFGVKLMSIAHRGTAPAMRDVIEERMDLLCDQTSNAEPYINRGEVKAYAVTGLQPVPTLSNLPTMDKSGYTGFRIGVWHAMWVPKGTPKPVIATLTKAVKNALADNKFQEQMKKLGAEVLVDEVSASAVKTKIEAEGLRWASLFRKFGIEHI